MYAITAKERLQQYARHKFGEYKAMEMKCGLSHGTLSYSSEPNVRVLQKIFEACPELSPDWVVLGQGPMERMPERLKPVSFAQTESEESDSIEQVSEPTQPYNGREKDGMITIPSSLLNALKQQLENKDAQIATLLQILNNPK